MNALHVPAEKPSKYLAYHSLEHGCDKENLEINRARDSRDLSLRARENEREGRKFLGERGALYFGTPEPTQIILYENVSARLVTIPNSKLPGLPIEKLYISATRPKLVEKRKERQNQKGSGHLLEQSRGCRTVLEMTEIGWRQA